MANTRISPAACLSELRRVAVLLRRDTLTTYVFDQHATISSRTVCERFGTWGVALREAGLTWRHNQWRETPLPTLAHALVQATVDLGHLPTCTELSRIADYNRNTLSDRWGGYVAFKRAALAHLLSPETPLPVAPDVRALLEAEQEKVTGGSHKRTPLHAPMQHKLGFRGFVYTPTNEQGVVALFGAVAQDLGFEILHTQAAYPDCLARYKRGSRRPPLFSPSPFAEKGPGDEVGRRNSPSPFAEKGPGDEVAVTRIEFEFRSRDFKAHAHDPAGADLIVCWTHDWPDTPLPVLELATAIKQLTPEPQRTRRSQRNNTQ